MKPGDFLQYADGRKVEIVGFPKINGLIGVQVKDPNAMFFSDNFKQGDTVREMVRHGTWKVIPGVTKKAEISPCGKYRYTLTRIWDETKRVLVWVCLNPSTADAEKDDATIRKLTSYAKAWGFGGILVLNIFAYRATDPKDLKKAKDPVGPDNLGVLKRTLRKLGQDGLGYLVIAAWGNHGEFQNQGEEIARLLKGKAKCLGLTKTGHPKHPLYLRKDVERIPFPKPPRRKAQKAR